MTYCAAEYETIGLCIALEAVDDMVNHALLDFPNSIDPGSEIEVRYKSSTHQDLFLLRLLDFAGEIGDKSLTGVSGSLLSVLLAACQTQSFDTDGSVSQLSVATSKLDDWLKTEAALQMWLPTLELDARLLVPRIEFLRILGNHSKHNLSRLTRISNRIATILQANGYDVHPEQVPLALDDFREHLHEDYFVYYGTWLAELINNVRWGVQTYLMGSYKAAYTPGESPYYSFKYPPSVTGDTPRAWFWRLMNHVRAGPYVAQFTGSSYMKREVLRDG